MNPLRLASILFTLIVLTLGMPIFWRAVATTEPTIHKAIQPIAATASTLTKADPATQARVNESYGKLPLSFEANHGQTDERVKFLSRGPGYHLFLTSTEAVLTLAASKRTHKWSREREHPSSFSAVAANSGPTSSSGDEMRAQVKRAASRIAKSEKPQEAVEDVLVMKLVNANAAAQVAGHDELPGKSNYFIGNDPSKWRTDVPNYAKVEYQEVYPGVKLVYYGNQRQLEYDFVVAPGADPRAIKLSFEGADKVKINKQGDLVLRIKGGEVVMRKPLVYQEVEGTRQQVVSGYLLEGRHRASFQVAAYDANRPLVIDPVLSYSTYLGGSGIDDGQDIAVDSRGNAYVTGWTGSTNFPTASPFQANFGGFADVFVTKVNPSGSALVYSTYLGGSGATDAGNGFDLGNGIAVDSSGNAYVTGYTDSTNFPTTPGAFDRTCGSDGRCNGFAIDAFVAKLNPAGNGLVYSTYLGGRNGDNGHGIAADSQGNAYVMGETPGGNGTNDFPVTPGAFDTSFNGSSDYFVTKLNPTGSALVYSTYLGGSLGEYAGSTKLGIAIDADGNAYVTGGTESPNFPTTPGAFDTTCGTDGQCNPDGSLRFSDVIVTKLNAAGSALIYSTFLGGQYTEKGNGIKVDSAGSAYVTGNAGRGFPTTPGAFQTTTISGDGFVTKLNPAGSGLVYSTFLTGNGSASSLDIAIDCAGNAHVTGLTFSPPPVFPLLNPIQSTYGGQGDAIVMKFNAAGSALIYSTYLGGNLSDVGNSIAVDILGNAYVTGPTNSTNFPTKDPLQPNYAGGRDAFITKIFDSTICGPVCKPVLTQPGQPGNPSVPPLSSEADQAQWSKVYSQLPLSFEANRGQTDGQVKFLSRGPGYNLFVTPTGATFDLRQHFPQAAQMTSPQRPTSPPAVLRMEFVGANRHAQVIGLEELPGKVNYLVGHDLQQWYTDVPTYARLEAHGLYPGVDLVYYGNQRQLEYDLRIAPGANPRVIKLAFKGAEKLEIDKQGDLILHMASGEIRQQRPLIYQEIDNIKQTIAGRYVLKGKHEVGFQVAKYDRRQPLIIDPVLSYSTYLGGLRTDEGYSIAVDAAGNAYITGRTFLGVFPTVNPLQTWPGDNDFNAFVTKINAAGTAIVYSTYLGGLRTDEAFGIAVDTAGNTYVTGRTFSQDFPTVNAFRTWPGDNDLNAFVTKINAAGNALVYSTYLGGLRTDEAFGIAVNSAGNAYVTGKTFSQDFPTVNASQTWPGDNDFNAFVTKLNAAGNALVYSTYLGGLRTDEGYGIAVDAADNAYVTGRTFIGVFPTVNPLQTWPGDNDFNAFVTKFNPSGTPIYSTYLGGLRSDCGCGIAVDTAGSAYVTGFTFSQDFPTANAFKTWPGDNDFNAFVTKINAAGSALAYSTYLGGLRTDEGYSIAVDAAGNAYVTGRTFLDTFPTVNPVMPWPGDNDFNAFVTKFNASGSPIYSTYLGGLRTDEGFGIAADANGNAYVTGRTFLGVFPTVNPLQTWPGDNDFNAFVTKITDTSSPTPTPTPTPSDTVPLTSAIPQTGSIPAPDPGFGRLSGIQYTIQVLSGATQLSVNLSGNQDVDLFVRFGQRITVSGGVVVADFKSESLTGNESITITPSSSPALQPGTYFIAVANYGPGAASFTLTATVTGGQPTTNPIDNPGFFVRQHYLDFLNRVPDQAGLDFWTAQITSCGTDAGCIEVRRVNVSAAYFLSIEFQQTGYLVERLYKAAYGSANGTSTIGGAHQLPVPIVRFNDFLPDTQRIGNGVVVGQTGWETVLENNKQAFTAEFVQRSRFTMAFPLTMTTAQFVDKLNMNAGNPLSQAERDNLVNSGMTRAQILRAVAEDQDLNNAEFNRAFVLMQFFGYLRRNPNDPPDTDYSGFEFWLTKLNQFNGNFQNAEMVKAFITSIEYRQRFGP